MKKNKSLCTGRKEAEVIHNHAFIASGRLDLFLCVKFQCNENGLHEPCAICKWPADEHPPVTS